MTARPDQGGAEGRNAGRCGSFLRRLEGFGPLPDADKALIHRTGTQARDIAAGTVLTREGDIPKGMVLVLDGFAYRYKLSTGGVRQIMAFLVPGDTSDLDGALLSHMDDSMATLSACWVVSVTTDVIEEMLQRPALGRALRMAALVNAATAREWVINVGRRTAVERVAHLFCELLYRLDAIGLVDQDGFYLPFTQVDLADTTGMSTVHMNRSMQSLRSAGLIELRSHRLTVLDRPGLRKLAEFRSNYLHFGDQCAACA